MSFRTHSAKGEFRRETFPFSIDTRSTSADDGTFSGYASVFNVLIPSFQEIVDPGAFTRTLQSRGDRVKVLWQHDPSDPIGLPTAMAEDTVGLRVSAQLADTPKIRQEYLPLLLPQTAGRAVIDRMSIGFTIVDDVIDPATGIWHLRDVELYEFSPVTFPANESAVIDNARASAVLAQAKRMLGLDRQDRALTIDDAKYGMALLMGARGAGSFSDLAPDDRRTLYGQLERVYTSNDLQAPLYTDRPPVYNSVEFFHDETMVFAARSLRKRISDVTSTARQAARLGVPLDSELMQEAQAALDAIQALGLEGVSSNLDALVRSRTAARSLGITVASA